MKRAPLLVSLIILGALVVVPAATGEEDESATPRVVCIAFVKDGDAASGKLEGAFLAKMRKAYEAKNVLFVKADVSTPGSTHQSRLLVNALGLNEVWQAYAKKPGHVVLVDNEYATIASVLPSTTTEEAAKAAFEKALNPPAEMEEPSDEEK